MAAVNDEIENDKLALKAKSELKKETVGVVILVP